MDLLRRGAALLCLGAAFAACEDAPADPGGITNNAVPSDSSNGQDSAQYLLDASDGAHAANDSDADPAGSVRSTLYPRGWVPGFADSTGRYLHDFSYAGYHNGEPLPALNGTTFAVATYGAIGDGTSDDTAAVQRAIDAASVAGGIVSFAAATYRFDGVLAITKSHVVLRGASKARTILLFRKTECMSDHAHITFSGAITEPLAIPLVIDAKVRDLDVFVAKAAGLAVGDDISVGFTITPAYIDSYGMTGTWVSFTNQAKPIFRRKIVAIDTTVSPVRIHLDVPLRGAALMRDKAEVRLQRGYLEEVGITSLSVGNAVPWKEAWSVVRGHAIRFAGVKDAFAFDVGTVPTPFATDQTDLATTSFHLQCGGLDVLDSKRVTVQQVSMFGAQNRGDNGAGYLFEISRSNDILTVDSNAEAGRHNFIQNWDFGTNGCVWLRCSSKGSRNLYADWDPIGLPASSEFHHSLATANLIDGSSLDDGWIGQNRLSESSGAGISATENVFWNTRGQGTIQSRQYGYGYVIGTFPGLTVDTALTSANAAGTAPEDFKEWLGDGAKLFPLSLYEDQRWHRLNPP